MYTPQDEKRLYEQAKHLLLHDAASAEDTAQQLREVINYADWKYYVQSEPVLSDAEYDGLFKKLKHIEQQHP
jgi:DNA ligase (NAD+)